MYTSFIFQKRLSLFLILTFILGLSPILISPVKAQSQQIATQSTAEALCAETAAADAGFLPSAFSSPGGGVFMVADYGVRYNTFKIFCATIGAIPGSEGYRQNVQNSVGYLIFRILLREITMDIVNWINTGFQGNPSFVQNPQDFLAKDIDRTIGNFIQDSNLNFLCEPFKINLIASLRFQYSPFRDTIGCRLSDVLNNAEGAYKDFMDGDFIGGGGWETWLSITTVPQNNQMGAMLIAQSELDARINNQSVLKNNELNWSGGFLSMKQCTKVAKDGNGNQISSYTYTGDSTYDVNLHPINRPIGSSETTTTVTPEDDDDHYLINSVEETCKIVTPGKAMSDQLSKVTSLDMDALNMADDINEIVGVLGNFVITKAINKGFALINKEELSPEDSSWRNGISQIQAQLQNGVNDYANNPQGQINTRNLISDNGGIIANPNPQGQYVSAEDTKALTDAKTYLKNSVDYYKAPEQSYYDAYSTIVKGLNTVISTLDKTTNCEEASTTLARIKIQKDAIVPQVVVSQNNLNALNNIYTEADRAMDLEDINKQGQVLNNIKPQLHIWNDETLAVASTTLNTINTEIVNAEAIKIECQ